MQKTSDLRKILIHIMLWLFYIFYETLILTIIDGIKFNFWETGINFALYATTFYINSLVLLPKFHAKKKFILYVLSLAGLVIAFVGCRYLINLVMIPFLNEEMIRPFSSFNLFLAQTVWRGGYFILLSFGYWFALNSIRIEKQKRIKEEQLREMEKNLMEAEIIFLKNQINPHFLFNTLNFFYSQIYPYSEDIAKGILILSDIMRYGLKEDNINGKEMLEKEVQHLKNYIAINQLRFSNTLKITFEVEGNLMFLMISPLLLITLVENCFKHGELLDEANPLKLKLKVVNNHLWFSTFNKKRSGPKEKSSGIGMANIKRRLEIVYHNNYTLNIKNEADYYTCDLKINL